MHINDHGINNTINILFNYLNPGLLIDNYLILVGFSLFFIYFVIKYYPPLMPVNYGLLIGIGISGMLDGIFNALSVIEGTYVSSHTPILVTLGFMLIGLLISFNNIISLSRYSRYYKNVIQIFTFYYELIIGNKVLILLIWMDVIFYYLLGTYTAINIQSVGTINLSYILHSMVTLDLGSIFYILGLSLGQSNFMFYTFLLIVDCFLIIIAYQKHSSWLPVLYAPLAGFALIGIYEILMYYVGNVQDVNNGLVPFLIILGCIVVGFASMLIRSNAERSFIIKADKILEKKDERKVIKENKNKPMEIGLSLNNEEYMKIILELSELSRNKSYTSSNEYLENVNKLSKTYNIDQSKIVYDIWKTTELLVKNES